MTRIAICGSQGSGKSTILRELSKCGYPTLEGKIARTILQDWNIPIHDVYNDIELTRNFQEEILTRKYREEQGFIINNDKINFVERTYADLFSYALLNIGRMNIHAEWLNSYYEQCKSVQQEYDLIFYLPSNMFIIEEDGVRSTNGHYGTCVDLVLQHYLKEMSSCPIITLDCASIEERIATIISTSEIFAS